jgi:hypothetical protein
MYYEWKDEISTQMLQLGNAAEMNHVVDEWRASQINITEIYFGDVSFIRIT